jgi:DNA replication protein DnaC
LEVPNHYLRRMAAPPQTESPAEPTPAAIVEANETTADSLLRDARDKIRSGESLAAQTGNEYGEFKDEYNARELAQPGCKNCGGSGYIGSGVMAPVCPCTQLATYRKAADMRINKLFGKNERQMTIASYDTGGLAQNELARNVAVNFVLDWQQAKEEGWILGFSGLFGTGKTHLVTGISLALIKKHLIRPSLLSVPKMLFLERQRFGAARGQAGESMIEAAMYADLTVLDDLGAEQRKQADDPGQVTWVQETLYLILDERIRNGLPTIYTTNLSRQELQEHFGAGTAGGRLWSRIERAQVMPALELHQVAEKNQKNVGARAQLTQARRR